MASLHVNMEPVENFLEKCLKENKKVTLTTVMCKALGNTF